MTRISDVRSLCEYGGMELVRDAIVRSFGFVEIPLPDRVVYAESKSFLRRALSAEGVSAIITTRALAETTDGSSVGLAISDNPRQDFVRLHNSLAESDHFYDAWETTRVDPTADVHATAYLAPRGVTVGRNCTIEARAIVLEGSELGEGVRLMAGAVIGSEGFQLFDLNGSIVDLKHVGGVSIGENTVVMANAVVARAVFRQTTTIGAECRIGNCAFVSHNCTLGPRTLIGHGAIVAGNTRIGRGVTVGPGAIFLDRLEVGDGAIITAGSLVLRDVRSGQHVTGFPALEHAKALGTWSRLRRGR